MTAMCLQRTMGCVGGSQPRQRGSGWRAFASPLAGPWARRQLNGSNSSSTGYSPSRWQRVHLVPQAGGGSGGGLGNGGGGGGGGGSGDDDEQPGQRKQGWAWKGWQERVAADPQFAFKVMIELIIGVSANVAGDMATRPNWGLNELDFVFATLVVGCIINFSAVYLLAPVAASGGATQASFLTKLFGDHYLLKWGAPTGHFFQPGFGIGARLTNYLYKGFIFGIIGLGAGVVGTATSNGLLKLRKKMDPSYSTPNEPPSVLGNACAWSLHMALSANTRYQVINGLDMVVQPLLSSPLFRAYTFVVRALNNLGGGMTYVMLVKALGVQKAGKEE